MDLAVSRWWSDGHDLLCVNEARTEREVGRYDRTTGRLSVGDQARVYEVVRALWAYLSGGAGEGEGDVEGAAEGVAEGEVAGGVVDDGVAYEAAATEVDLPQSREPHDGGGRVVELRAVPAGPETLGQETGGVSEGAAAEEGMPEGTAAGTMAEVTGRAGTRGGGGGGGKVGRVVDRRLGLLRRDGWVVLSSVGLLAGGAEIDRLVVGPPGVFAIMVRRGDEAAQILRGGLHENRYDAQAAGRVLSEASGLSVTVRAILALVGPGGEELAEGIPGARRTIGVIGTVGASGVLTRSGRSGAAGWSAAGGNALGKSVTGRHAAGRDSAAADEVLVVRAEEIVEVLRDLPSVYSLDERYRLVDAARDAARGAVRGAARGTASWGPIAA